MIYIPLFKYNVIYTLLSKCFVKMSVILIVGIKFIIFTLFYVNLY